MNGRDFESLLIEYGWLTKVERWTEEILNAGFCNRHFKLLDAEWDGVRSLHERTFKRKQEIRALLRREWI